MNKENFHKILIKSPDQCDGYELHLQELWKERKLDRIFYITGLDFNGLHEGENQLSHLYSEQEIQWIKEFYAKHQKRMLYGDMETQ